MQAPFSCLPPVLAAIEATMSPARLARFMGAAKGDPQLALRLYIWNAQLCEAFYVPLQIAEVSIRNAVHLPVVKRFGPAWYSGLKFMGQLPQRYQDEVFDVVQTKSQLNGAAFTVDHVVSGLTFGFWVHLLTARYDNILWQGGVFRSFPNTPKGMARNDVHLRIEALRNFRNKVAHHSAIFDQGPKAHFQNLCDVVSMICADTHWLLLELATVEQAINSRPR